jgi:hypothetical protein
MSRAHTFTVYRTDQPLTGLESPSQKLFLESLARFQPGEDFVITVKPLAKRQGSQAMKFYRGVVVPDIARASGVTDPDDYEAVHEALAWKFLRIGDHPFGYPRRRSTAKGDMSQEEMSTYIDQCITYAETTIPGCRVRRPDEVDLDQIPGYGWAP